jgi:hypothetical protein
MAEIEFNQSKSFAMKSIISLATIALVNSLHAAPCLSLSQPYNHSSSSKSKAIWLNDHHNLPSSEIEVVDKVLISELSQEERQRV